MARGGHRNATPGKAYPNRTDMAAQPVRAATGQAYGTAGAQEAAQQAVPLPSGGGMMGGAPQGPPVQAGPFDRPTDRPGEPVTHGLDIGAGGGSEALNPAGTDDDFASQLQAIYSLHPNNDLLRLIEEMRNG